LRCRRASGCRAPTPPALLGSMLTWRCSSEWPYWQIPGPSASSACEQHRLMLSPTASRHAPAPTLCRRCWAQNHFDRPSFDHIIPELRCGLSGVHAPCQLLASHKRWQHFISRTGNAALHRCMQGAAGRHGWRSQASHPGARLRRSCRDVCRIWGGGGAVGCAAVMAGPCWASSHCQPWPHAAYLSFGPYLLRHFRWRLLEVG
jgi:hypothetical protein